MTRALPILTVNRACTACEFHQDVRTVCVGARPYRPLSSPASPIQAGPNPAYPRCDQALYIIGEAPGDNEDRTGHAFVGDAGLTLHWTYIRGGRLDEFADVYLGNAIRCRLPRKTKPRAKHLAACAQFWKDDLTKLQKVYKKVTILCCGTIATQSVLGCLVSASFKRQGSTITINGKTVSVYSTYHPSYLGTGRGEHKDARNPAAVVAVQDHLSLLRDNLRPETAKPSSLATGGGRKGKSVEPVVLYAPEPPTGWFPRELSLDSETYGLFKTAPPQRFFHPASCIAQDGVRPHRLVRLISLAWEGPRGALCSAIFRPSEPGHLNNLCTWLERLRHVRNASLLGMNLLYDLLFLRAASPRLRQGALALPSAEDPEALGELALRDLAITSFLHSAERPERSLKDLCRLFGLADYDPEFRPVRAFLTDRDPASWAYCRADSLNTIRADRHLQNRILLDYPPAVSALKLSAYTRRAYSNLLWELLAMTEVGVPFSLSALRGLHASALDRMTALRTKADAAGFGPLSGEGSGKYAADLLDRAAALVRPEALPFITRTPRTSAISTDEYNSRVIRRNIDPSCKEHEELSVLADFRKARTLMSTYTHPFLHEHKAPRKGIMPPLLIPGEHDIGRAYPTVYPVPSEDRYNQDEGGGTVQCRLSYRDPSPQKLHPDVFACLRPPRGWVILCADLSQIELRIAALVFNARSMLDAFADPTRDLHSETAESIYGSRCLWDPHEWRKHRQAGKTDNFQMIYRGCGMTVHLQLFKKYDTWIDPDECEAMVEAAWAERADLWAGQEAVIKQVAKDGFLAIPLIGASRWFPGGERVVRSAYIPTICNFQVQALAVWIMYSAQITFARALRRLRLRSKVFLQIHDAFYTLVPREELPQVQPLLIDHLQSPPFYRDLCAHYGRSVPLQHDIKTIYPEGRRTTVNPNEQVIVIDWINRTLRTTTNGAETHVLSDEDGRELAALRRFARECPDKWRCDRCENWTSLGDIGIQLCECGGNLVRIAPIDIK